LAVPSDIAAEVEKKAALDRAEATKTLATAEAESNKIEAVGVRNIGETRQQRHRFRDRPKRIETMPSALAEMMRPIANLKDVLHTGGAFGGNGSGASKGGVADL